MRVLKQVLSVTLNDKKDRGAWEGNADYDGAIGTMRLTLDGVAPDRAVAVLEAIEAAVETAHGGSGGQSILFEKRPAPAPAPTPAYSKDVQSAIEAVHEGMNRVREVAARTASAFITPPEASDFAADAVESKRPIERAAEVIANSSGSDETAAHLETLVEDLEPASPVTSGYAAVTSGDEIAAAIDKAAREAHAASGSLFIGKFVQICAEHDPAVRAEIAASIGGDKCVATKRHVDRNVKYFVTYANRDDTARSSRLMNTMRGIVAAAPSS